MNARLIKPDGTEVEIKPANSKWFSFDELYKHMECDMIEVVWKTKEKGMIMIVDEDGRFKKSAPNPKATALVTLPIPVMLVGNVVVCPRSMFK
jgi:hypothetical protein